MDDLYLSMICLEHAHYLVAMQDHVQINKYTPLPVSRVIRGSLRLAPNQIGQGALKESIMHAACAVGLRCS